ncbi:MAG: RNA polymerase factor sigma-54 [Candidatus Omnitrophota bacterium]
MYMDLKQKLELRHLLLPQLRQSLKILALPLLDLKNLLEQELVNNPFLEEIPEAPSLPPATFSEIKRESKTPDLELRISFMTRETTLQDVLLRQLGMFTSTDEELKIGQEIIGNIDENGYLTVTIEELAASLGLSLDKVECVLRLIQQFEPAGVAARGPAECLLIQLGLSREKDPLVIKIVESHLEDVAKKNFTHIAKCLKEPLNNIESCVKKILKLDPKPGRNYAADEHNRVVPDIFIEEDEDDLAITINKEDTPTVKINQDYKAMLKNPKIDPQTKEFLKEKLQNALELLRAINKRRDTLRKVVEVIAEIQQDAIRHGLSRLKPFTFKDVAQRIGMHETTICRVVMNKYAQTPHQGIIALKDFFSSHVHDQNGQAISSSLVKRRIKELTDGEDRKHPLSDEDIVGILLKEDNLKVARRTVAKYREELKILSSAYRREH